MQIPSSASFFRNLRTTRQSVLILAGSIATLTFSGLPSAKAATFTWDGGGADNAAATPENWLGDIVPDPAGFDIIFSGASPIGTTVDWNLAKNFRSLTFDALALGYTIAGSTPIQFITPGIDSLVNNSANAQTITDQINVFFNGSKGVNASTADLNVSNVTFRGDAMTSGQTNTLTLLGTANGSISGVINQVGINAGVSTALVKSGTGTWTLSGANTYTGVTTVNGGVLVVGNADALGTTAGGTVQTGASEIRLTGGIVTAAEALTITGGGISNFGALRNFSGDNTWSGTITMAVQSRINSDSGTLTLNAPTAVTSNNFIFVSGGAGDTVISGIVALGNGGIGKDGAGTLTLSGANTYNGATTISGGVIVVGNANALGSTVGGTVQTGASEIRLTGGIVTAAEALTITGGGISNFGALRNFSGDNTWSGTVTLAGQSRINSDAGTLTLSAPTAVASNNQNLIIGGAGNMLISGAVALGTGGVNKADGAGTLTLSGANTYTGATTIAAGTLINGSASTFTNKGALAVNGTSTFDLNGFNASFTAISSVAGTTITNGGSADVMLTASNAPGALAGLVTDGPTNKLGISVANANSGSIFLPVNSANTFSGGVTVLDGSAVGAGTRLRFGAGDIISTGTVGAIVSSPVGTGTVTIGLAATDRAGLMFDGTPNRTLLNDIVFNTALGNDNPGIRVDNTSPNLTFAGKITANLSNAMFSSAGSVNLTGQVTGAFGLQTNANQTIAVTLNNAADNNDYAGNTITGATSSIILGRANQIPNGAGKGNVVSNGTVNLAGFNETINGLSGTGVVEGGSGAPTLTIGDSNAGGDFSGIIRNTAGALALVKTGSGTQTISGANTFSGGTTVNGGRLIVGGLGLNGSLTLAATTSFSYQPKVASPLALGTGVLTLNGNTVGTAIGGTLSQSGITSSSAAVASGAITINVRAIPGVATTAGANDLITASSGLTSGGATYALGNVYNATDFTVTGLTSSDSAVTLNTVAATPLTGAFWKGGLAGGNNVWALSNGTSASNWSSDAGGTATPLVPGVGAAVSFSATGATNQSAMTLGANMTIKSLAVSDPNAITLNDDGNTLTISNAAAITIAPGAGAVTLNPIVAVGAGQTWTNNSSNPLTFGAPVSNGANLLTIGGTGPTNIATFNAGSGGLTVTGGTTTISNYVQPILASGGALLVSGGTLNVNNTSLTTAQTWTSNSTSAGLIAGNVSNYSNFLLTVTGTGNTQITGGLSGGGALTKTGTGTLTLSGANSYTGVTTIGSGSATAGGGGVLILSGTKTGATGNVLVGNGATLQLQSANALGTAGVTGSQLTLFTGSTLRLRSDSSLTFNGSNGIAGLNNATIAIDVDRLSTGSGNVLTASPGTTGFGNAVTFNVTGGNGYSLGLGTFQNIVGAAGTLTFNPTTANVSFTGFQNQVAGAFNNTLVLGGTTTANAVTGVIANQGPGSTGTGTTAVTKSTSATWTLAGASTYTGATTISNGTLNLTGSVTGTAITVSGAAVLSESGTGIIGGASTLTYSSSATSTLSGPNTYTGLTTVGAGVLKAGSAVAFTSKGQLTVNGTGTFDLNGNNAAFTVINNGVATGTLTNSGAAAVLTGSAQGANVITNLITGNLALQIANAHSASTSVALGNANTFNGGLTLLNGTGSGTRLRITGLINTVGSPGAIVSSPYGTGPITLGKVVTDKAGILFDTVANNTLVNDIVFNTALGTDVPGVRFDTLGNTLSGTITANLADATISTGNATVSGVTLTGKITGALGFALTPPTTATTPTLTVTLNSAAGPNDYAGNTTISKVASSNYVLALGAANQIPNGAGKGSVVNNGTLNLNGFSETINGLTGTANGIVDSVSGTSTLTVGDGNAGGSFSGVLKNTGGTLALTKIGSGLQTLGGANTYSGDTNVNAGHLQVTGTLTGTIVNVNANASANFEASQTLPALNIGDGAVVTLGALPPAAPAPSEDFGGAALLSSGVGQPVPEPGSAMLLLSGLGALLGVRRRSK